MRSSRRVRCEEEPMGPAIAREDHIRDREISPAAGAPKGWRVLSVLELAHERGQLDDREGDAQGRRYRAARRLEAGDFYAKRFMVAQSTGLDSTAIDCVASVSTRRTLSEGQAEAIRALAKIENHMGLRDRRIVRMVCGENFRLNEAVMSVCGKSYRQSVTLRFREALDALVEALEAVRRHNRSPQRLATTRRPEV